MDNLLSSGLIWWITVVDIPVMSALFALIWKTRKECLDQTGRLTQLLDTRHSQMREALSAYKLEVAKSYVSGMEARELEDRVVKHLLRIEAKLDATALKTAALTQK